MRAIFGNFQHIFSPKNPEFRTYFLRFSTIFGKKGPLNFWDENNISIVMNTVIDYDMRDYVLTRTFVSCWSHYYRQGKVVIIEIVGGLGGL